MNKKNLTLRESFAKAVQSFKSKDYKKAEVYCYKILSIDPNHLDSISLLSTIAAINNNFDKAKKLLHQSLEIKPKNTPTLNNLGTIYKESGKFKEAIVFFEKALKVDVNHVNSNYNLGTTYYKLKDLKKAKFFLKKTVELQDNYALAFFALGNVHVDLKELHEAVSCYQKTIEIRPDFVNAYNNLGLVFRDLNDFKNAVDSYEKAIKIKPDYASAHHNLGIILKEQGDFKKAIQSHELAAKHEPDDLSHYFFLSDLKKEILDSNLKIKINDILKNKSVSVRNKAYGNYLLARYERSEKNYDTEFKHLIEGHNNYFNSKKQIFDLAVKYCFTDVIQINEGAKVEKANSNSNYEKPIFIVGVPRCGSTLVERIIASGKKIIPIGEESMVMENFINAIILEKQSLNLGDVNEVGQKISNVYKSKGLVSKKFDYTFTDKSLNNFFYLSLIKDIYPKAKIINCKRDVLSSIVSIFQNNLASLAWTHNLENIFKYFDNYFKIIKTFTEAHPDLIYNLEFEKLVDNPEQETKKLMDYCELTWDQKCLEFYKRSDLFSKTASNVQIRQPIYKDSANKYLPYKKFLSSYGKKYNWFN